VTIEYVLGEYPDTPEGNLNKNLKAVIAEYERLKIAERMTRGRRLKTKAGSVMAHGTTPFGYRLVIQNNMQALEIHEPEAQTVRLIFTWYTEGNGEEGPMTIRGITRKLHELGMDIPRSTINRILSSETYGGVWHYGKWGSDGKKRFRNPDDHLIAVEVPPIVAPEVVELAMSKRKANKEQAGRKPKYEYLLSGRLICGTCGGKMRAAPRNYTTKAGDRRRTLYYRCNTTGSKEDRHKCSNKTCYRADIADAAVWGEIVKLLQDRERLTQGFTDYLADREIENGPIRERLDVVESLIADNRKQLGRAIDLYLSGDFPKEMLTERKMRLETTIAALEKEQAGLTDRLEARTLTEGQLQSLQEFATKIEEKLECANFRIRRGVIETLDIQVTLTLEQGQQVAYIHCTLPGQDTVLELSQHTSTQNRPFTCARGGSSRWSP
jgi:site-specific DNA recombinase